MQNELNQANFNDMEKLIEENNRYRATIQSLTNDLSKKETEIKEINSMQEDKDKEIEKYKEEIEQLKKKLEKNLKIIKI